jgi:hypothetical protein
MYLSNMQIFSATDNIRSKHKRIQAILRTTSVVCLSEMQLMPGKVLVHYADTVSTTKRGTK